MTQATKLVNWFEIPVTDINRAISYYQALFNITLTVETIGPSQLAVFPYQEPNTGGCLCFNPTVKPSLDGVRIYLNCQAPIETMLAKVESIGGKVIVPKTALPEGMGVFATMQDSEGNAVGLHGLV